MSDQLKAAIATLQGELALQEEEVANTKRLINQLAKRAGLPPPYGDAELLARSGLSFSPDQFYGQPLHIAMRTLLEMRKASNPGAGPASVNQIFDALREGGYQFDAKNDENAKRIIRIMLTKNSGVFHKLPNGHYGLLSWYPGAKAAKVKTKGEDATGNGTNGDDGDADDDTDAAGDDGDEASESASEAE